ncbi:MAG TPA: hypothetical protein PKD05_06565, partial [Candidatus Melainabacteria bacterium]|nr:hypothetical protein [Candidatus Melainabacteria bacterium]
ELGIERYFGFAFWLFALERLRELFWADRLPPTIASVLFCKEVVRLSKGESSNPAARREPTARLLIRPDFALVYGLAKSPTGDTSTKRMISLCKNYVPNSQYK